MSAFDGYCSYSCTLKLCETNTAFLELLQIREKCKCFNLFDDQYYYLCQKRIFNKTGSSVEWDCLRVKPVWPWVRKTVLSLLKGLFPYNHQDNFIWILHTDPRLPKQFKTLVCSIFLKYDEARRRQFSLFLS